MSEKEERELLSTNKMMYMERGISNTSFKNMPIKRLHGRNTLYFTSKLESAQSTAFINTYGFFFEHDINLMI